MTIQESARILNEAFKTEREKNLETKIKELEKRIEQLEKILINALNRLDYLENNQWR